MNEPRGKATYLWWTLFVVVEAAGLAAFVLWKLLR
jgi:hypothetical protein